VIASWGPHRCAGRRVSHAIGRCENGDITLSDGGHTTEDQVLDAHPLIARLAHAHPD
jgi:hypothetical protein